MVDIRGCVDLILDSFIFHTWRTSQLEKINDFLAGRKCSKVICTVLSTDKGKLLQDLCPTLLEQPRKFVLTYKYVFYARKLKNDHLPLESL